MDSRLPVFRNMDGFEPFLAERARAAKMEVGSVALDHLRLAGWRFDLGPFGAVFKRIDSSFFDVVGVSVTTSGPEVSGWEQPMLEERGPGFVALFTHDVVTTYYALVRMIAEPGNMGYNIGSVDAPMNSHVLVAPSFQASHGNLTSNPGKVPLASFVVQMTPEVAPGSFSLKLKTVTAPKEGGRYLHSFNHQGLLVVKSQEREALESAVLALPEDQGRDDYAWVSRSLLREIRDRGWANAHLWSAMALLV